ncbi:D-serine dehydratase [Eurytemora carolleeae]|uniref:D-serine dehydratase n=1 Tax=Eurytemora carolleeae TaxID=1294199 RepID=UPI000C76F2BD|nr:D-serine dehydratase [Eurytemora carolleeae]|eukprot:XP_023329119.1 D-serine dehydratase-like [Eurytemora affinis]
MEEGKMEIEKQEIEKPDKGKSIYDLSTPSFLVDIQVYQSNCSRMLELARTAGISLRGQTKTHKTVEGGVLQTGGSRRKIVTSTLLECEMYAKSGFEDILFGFPLIPQHLPRVYKLRSQLDAFHVMVANLEICIFFQDSTPPQGKKWSIVLKIDCGNERAGVWWEEASQILEIARFITASSNLKFQGIYVHCGNSYHSNTPEQVKDIRNNALNSVKRIADWLEDEGIKCIDVGIGSTPSCSHPTPALSALSEIHPGNYVFYDAMQMELGSCQESDIAGTVLTRIIGHYPRRNQLLIDCGFTGFTKQGLGKQQDKRMLARIKGCPELMVTDMTQEIGFVDSSDSSLKIQFEKFPVGSTLQLIPYHSCATAACYNIYHVHREEKVTDTWAPCKGW